MPGQLLGCAFGPLDVLGRLFGGALLSLGAYAAETVGLLWAALRCFSSVGAVVRCSGVIAHPPYMPCTMHGQVDGKPHSVCRAARSLHLALLCLLGSGVEYKHVAGHSGDCANELADALAARGPWKWHVQPGHVGFAVTGTKRTLVAGRGSLDPFLRALPTKRFHAVEQQTVAVDCTFAWFNALSIAGDDCHSATDGGLHKATGRIWTLCTSLVQAGLISVECKKRARHLERPRRTDLEVFLRL